MEKTEIIAAIESILFVAGEAVPIAELQRVLELTDIQLRPLLFSMEEQYRNEGRGIQLMITEETAQLCSNKEYAPYIEQLLQPMQTKTFSQALLETLAVIAYRQPVTRSDIEAVRGVRCEYAVTQLLKLGFIRPVGRKDVAGRPVLFGTTDIFLRQFGIHALSELPAIQENAD